MWGMEEEWIGMRKFDQIMQKKKKEESAPFDAMNKEEH